MRRSSVVTPIVPFVLISACQPGPPDLEAEGRAIMTLSREWSDLVEEGDVDAFIGYWAEDAVMMPPDSPPIEGRAAIREYVEGAMAMPGFSIRWEPVSVHVAGSGDMAYMLERNVTTMSDSLGNPVTVHGKVVTVWRKGADGAWKNVVDMWNGAPPPEN